MHVAKETDLACDKTKCFSAKEHTASCRTQLMGSIARPASSPVETMHDAIVSNEQRPVVNNIVEVNRSCIYIYRYSLNTARIA